jgi:hypothetical protein
MLVFFRPAAFDHIAGDHHQRRPRLHAVDRGDAARRALRGVEAVNHPPRQRRVKIGDLHDRQGCVAHENLAIWWRLSMARDARSGELFA